MKFFLVALIASVFVVCAYAHQPPFGGPPPPPPMGVDMGVPMNGEMGGGPGMQGNSSSEGGFVRQVRNAPPPPPLQGQPPMRQQQQPQQQQ